MLEGEMTVPHPARGDAIAEGRFDRSLIPVYKEDGTLALDREELRGLPAHIDAGGGARPSTGC